MNVSNGGRILTRMARFLAVFALGVVVLTTGAASSRAASVTSRYVPVGPSRLADTRSPQAGGYSTIATTRTDATLRVPVAGQRGVPANATAAVLTVTVTGTGGAGFVTVYPSGQNRPTTSTLNMNGAGETVPNSTIVPLGAGGAVDIYISGSAKIIVDVAGAFVPSGAASSGRYIGLDQAHRALDTRLSGGSVRAGASARVARPARVPSDASAVIANLTVTQSAGAGYWTAWPSGAAMPNASVLNSDRANQTRAAMVVVPVSAAGFDVFSSGGGHLIVDIVGYFTGNSAGSSDVGLFVAHGPDRRLDTRQPAPLGNARPVPARGAVEFSVPFTASAVVFNLTSTGAASSGFTTAYPAGVAVPNASNLNASVGVTVANLAVATASTRGIGLYSDGGEHLLADVTGYFTGSPVAAINPPPPVPPSVPAGCLSLDATRVNQFRAEVGAQPLQFLPSALDFACQWSRHMGVNDVFVHSTGSARDAVVGCLSGENIAMSTGNHDFIDMWRNSPGHYRNMISPSYTHIGIGVVEVNGARYGTMILAAC